MTGEGFRENGGMPSGLLALFAVVAGVTVANLYYNQPLLGMIARDLRITELAVNQMPMMTQLGYATGLLFLIPLGDMYPRRKILRIDFILLLFALLAIATARCFSVLLIASYFTGVCSVVPQMFVPIASQLSTPQTKGKNVGIVISGLLIGILASRVVSGVVGEYFGWRTMYYVAAGLMLVCYGVVSQRMPELPSTFKGRYSELMRSILELVRKQPLLRVASVRAALGFASFLVLWSTLAFHMEQAPFYAGSDVTGILGLCGIFGALTASFVGRYVKKVGENRFNTIGCLLFMLAWWIFYAGGYTYAGMIAGIILMDIAMQCLQLSNQVTALSLEQGASNRLNTVFMTIYFAGGALGTFLAGVAWTAFGWEGVAGTGALLVLVSFVFHIRYCRKNNAPFCPWKRNRFGAK